MNERGCTDKKGVRKYQDYRAENSPCLWGTSTLTQNDASQKEPPTISKDPTKI